MIDTSPCSPRLPLRALGCLLFALAGDLHAQDAGDAAPAPDVPTLDRVQALRPEEEIVDLYRFDNPVTFESSKFEKMYDPGPTPEEVALEHGGFINYGINLGLGKSWRGFKKVTGMRADIQAANARPPPLSAEQARRAAGLCERGGDGCSAGN